jgi:hypothetical protein
MSFKISDYFCAMNRRGIFVFLQGLGRFFTFNSEFTLSANKSPSPISSERLVELGSGHSETASDGQSGTQSGRLNLTKVCH